MKKILSDKYLLHALFKTLFFVVLYSDVILDAFSEMMCKDLAPVQFFLSSHATTESVISTCD